MIILAKKSATIQLIAQRGDFKLARHVYEIPSDEKVVIRWGNISPLMHEAQQVNDPDDIKNAANKPFCRKLLAENGIPVPELTETKFPCIGRPTHHSEGRKFFICHTPRDIERAKRQGATYFSVVYPKTQEYRVHIGSGRCLLMSVKEGRKEGRICWNHYKTGFTFRHMHRSEWLDDERLMRIVRLAKNAVEVVGLDFAAVDIMSDPTDSHFPPEVVAEINTAPSLSDLAIEKYIMYFKKFEEE